MYRTIRSFSLQNVLQFIPRLEAYLPPPNSVFPCALTARSASNRAEHPVVPQFWSSSGSNMVVLLTLVIILIVPSALILGVYVIYRWSAARRASQWRRCNIPFSPPTFPLGHDAFSCLTSASPLVAFDRIYRENADEDLVGFFATSCPFILIRDPRLIQRLNDLTFGKLKTQVNRMWRHIEEPRLVGQPTKAQFIARNFVVDFLSTWHFGEDSNSYRETAQIEQICETYYEPRIRRLLAFWAQVHFPSLQIFESFRFTSQKSKHAMGKFLRRKMDHRMAHGNCGDFVDLMKRMQSKTCWNAQSTSTLDLEDEGLNMRQMIGLSFVLLVAGTDAVASVCHLTLHLLSLYPEHQKKVQQEIDQGMAKHGVSELTLSVVQDLQFLEQCLMETLRLYPSLFAIVRTCTEDFHISGTRYKFRKGDKLMIIPYSINRDPKYFKNPDDFEPDRFSPENRGSMPPETFLTFGIGPRKCPGYRIGLHIAATFVASLLCKYTLKPCSHLRQLGAADFDPLWFSLQYAKNSILIDFVPRVVNPMTTEH
ncbi:probable cytochrome P450 6d2 isoform X3 [Bemisia tabaci]|uniref:probable cytochrome P450 6d2 isoform X3 n=1 Tax=Bemisia tabaci TaxID=7038 RepID=UPI003B28C3A1